MRRGQYFYELNSSIGRVWQKETYTLYTSPVYRRANTHIITHIHAYSSFTVTNYPTTLFFFNLIVGGNCCTPSKPVGEHANSAGTG